MRADRPRAITLGADKAYDCRNVDEYILATALRLDEAVALCELNHFTVPVGILSLLPSRIYNPGKQAPIALA